MAGTQNTETTMDYAEHDRTYEGFVEFSKVGSVACLNVLVALVFVHLGYGFLSILFVVGLLVTATIGIALRPKGFMLGVAQLVIGLVLMAFLGL